MSIVRGFLAQLGCLTLILVVGLTAWFARDTAWSTVRRWMGKPAEWNSVVIRVEPQFADSVDAKIARLRSVGEVTLTMSEVQSWVTYRLEPTLPSYIYDVRVALLESKLRLDAQVWTRQIPGLAAEGPGGTGGVAGPIAGLIGDTAEVSVIGPVDGIGRGRAAFFVEQLLVSGIPLPDLVRDRILASLGPRPEGLPAHAVVFPLPPPAWDIAVRGGALVLRAPTASPRGSAAGRGSRLAAALNDTLRWSRGSWRRSTGT